MPETSTTSPGSGRGPLALSTKTPPVASWTKNRPFRAGSAAVTTPVTSTLRLRAARSAGREITSAALVKRSLSRSAAMAGAPSRTNKTNHPPGAGASCEPRRFSFVSFRTIPDFTAGRLKSPAYFYPSKEGWCRAESFAITSEYVLDHVSKRQYKMVLCCRICPRKPPSVIPQPANPMKESNTRQSPMRKPVSPEVHRVKLLPRMTACLAITASVLFCGLAAEAQPVLKLRYGFDDAGPGTSTPSDTSSGGVAATLQMLSFAGALTD